MVAPRSETESMFRKLDGDWWNSQRRVPDKFLVLKRNYDMSDDRLPTPVPFERTTPWRLTLPQTVDGFSLPALGQLQIHPGQDMQMLSVPETFYTPGQFQGLADRAERADQTQLGDQRGQLGFNGLSSLGVGLELDSSQYPVFISRTRLVARYMFGDNTRGYGVGLAMSF